MQTIDETKKKSHLSFLALVDEAAKLDPFVQKVEYAMKNYYLENKGSLSVKYLYHLARTLKHTEFYNLIEFIDINLETKKQKQDLKALKPEQFDLISISLTDDQKYFYFHYNIEGINE